MQEMYNLDVDSFRARPYEGQVAFVAQIIESMQSRIDDELADNDIVGLHYTENPTTTPQEIQNNFAYAQIVAARLITKDSSGTFAFDTETALKMASAIGVPDGGFWDEAYGQMTMGTLWGFQPMMERFETTIDSVSLNEDGTVAGYVCHNTEYSATVQVERVNYTSASSENETYYIITSQVDTPL
jgi:hypothetical protein